MKVKHLNNVLQEMTVVFREELKKYEELKEVAQEQYSCITEDNTEVLRSIMRKREDIIGQLEGLNNLVNKYKREVTTILHLKEFDLTNIGEIVHNTIREELSKVVKNIGDTINQIADYDDRSQWLLNEKLTRSGTELKKIHEYRELQQAYFDRPERFIDPQIFDKKK